VKLSAVEERGRGQDELYNVIRAYSLYDPEVGYVQGSAFIVAALLLNVSRSPESWLLWSLGGLEEGRRADRGLIALRQMPDEEAFCVLVRLMHSVSSSHLLLLTLPLHFPSIYLFPSRPHPASSPLPLEPCDIVRPPNFLPPGDAWPSTPPLPIRSSCRGVPPSPSHPLCSYGRTKQHVRGPVVLDVVQLSVSHSSLFRTSLVVDLRSSHPGITRDGE
jgi:hypothetical protein